jgi:dTDP-4-dehydrorhamnose 3,5-epimerase-like enzyme
MLKQLGVCNAQTNIDMRGKLSVVEGASLPFEIKRIYYLYDVPQGATRGEHGHRKLEQVLLCPAGAVEVMVCDGSKQEFFTLREPSTLLHIPPGSWRRVRFLEPGSVLCVLASRPYEPDDYIHDYQEFLQWKTNASSTVN